MINVISQSQQELTTEEVIDWIAYLGGRASRLNGDVIQQSIPSVRVNSSGCHFRHAEDLPSPSFEDVMWYRRWNSDIDADVFASEGLPIDEAVRLNYLLKTQVTMEQRTLKEFFLSQFKHPSNLSGLTSSKVNKLMVLQEAVKVGLAIPDTLITGSKAQLVEFYKEKGGEIITKVISDVVPLSVGETHYHVYTERVEETYIDSLSATFFPSLFQENIVKDYELRVFFIDDELYPMAIFSQNNPKTSQDFRKYDFTHPNRCVPYRLPDDVAAALGKLAMSLNLRTGSYDLLKSKNGSYVFLEVNPVGQFGMVSSPCNYHLERRLAQVLLNEGGAHV